MTTQEQSRLETEINQYQQTAEGLRTSLIRQNTEVTGVRADLEKLLTDSGYSEEHLAGGIILSFIHG